MKLQIIGLTKKSKGECKMMSYLAVKISSSDIKEEMSAFRKKVRCKNQDSTKCFPQIQHEQAIQTTVHVWRKITSCNSLTRKYAVSTNNGHNVGSIYNIYLWFVFRCMQIWSFWWFSFYVIRHCTHTNDGLLHCFHYNVHVLYHFFFFSVFVRDRGGT